MDISPLFLLISIGIAGLAGGFAAGWLLRLRRRETQAENADANAERLEDIIDLATDWVWETDSGHRYTYVSPRLIEHTGLPLEHWLNTTRLDTLAQAHDQETVAAHIRDIEAHRPFRNLEYWIDRPTGIYCFQTSGKPKFDKEGNFLGYRGTGRDITARKRAEAELEKIQKEMLRRERQSTLDQLTAKVSHELRNPLGAIRNSTYVLKTIVQSGDQKVDHALDRIDRNVIRCDRIISEFLDFGNISSVDLAPAKIDDWLGRMLDMQPVPEGITVVREFHANGAICDIDSEALRRSILNLYENACQAMLSMEGAKDCQARILTVSTAIGDNYEIAIRDTGVGLSAETLPRLFEPMFSTKSFGIGLGLPIAQRIAMLHGGRIELSAGEGGGAVARLVLPAHKD